MSDWMHTDRFVGMWAAGCAAIIGVLFVLVGLIGVTARPPSSDTLRQVDPYLAILETLMILFTVALVITISAVHACAPPERKIFSLAALAFNICFAVLTCGVHFVSLTVGRQIRPEALSLQPHQLSFEEWPSIAMSLDLLAWDFFLGLSLIFAARAFRGKATLRPRVGLTVAGLLCLAGSLGPASGNLRIQYLGIAGYAFVLPIVCAFLSMAFRPE
jgi:hypothetical protein